MSNRAMVILIMIAVLGVVGSLLVRQFVAEQGSPQLLTEQPEPASSRKTRVRATMSSCSRIGNRTRLVGIIHNLGTTTLSAITVQSIWKNEAGQILDTGLVYAVGKANPLKPNEQRRFIDSTMLKDVARCNVRPLDWFSAD